MASSTPTASGSTGFDMDVFAQRLKDSATGELWQTRIVVFLSRIITRPQT